MRRNRKQRRTQRTRKRMQGGGRTSCPAGQHWMPPTNGNPGYCMPGAYHGAPSYQTGGGVSGVIWQNNIAWQCPGQTITPDCVDITSQLR